MWRVCIQVELVTGELSPVCASCFTTSRPSCTFLREAASSPALGHHRRRRCLRPVWALTILYDREPLLVHRSCDAVRHIIEILFWQILSLHQSPFSLSRFWHSVLWIAVCFLRPRVCIEIPSSWTHFRLSIWQFCDILYEKMIWRKCNPPNNKISILWMHVKRQKEKLKEGMWD